MGKVMKFTNKSVSVHKSEIFTTFFSFRKADGGHPIDIITDVDIVISLQKITFPHNMVSSITTHDSLTSMYF